MSSFKYLISLDLEATCWPGKYTNQENAEIIGKFKMIKINILNIKIEIFYGPEKLITFITI